jgi:hypothetical protein
MSRRKYSSTQAAIEASLQIALELAQVQANITPKTPFVIFIKGDQALPAQTAVQQ